MSESKSVVDKAVEIVESIGPVYSSGIWMKLDSKYKRESKQDLMGRLDSDDRLVRDDVGRWHLTDEVDRE